MYLNTSFLKFVTVCAKLLLKQDKVMRLLPFKRQAYIVKKVIDFPVPCPVTSRLGTGKPLTFFTV